MDIKLIDEKFIVCKISDILDVDFEQEYVFLSKTDDEISLVMRESSLPGSAYAVEYGWQAFKIARILDFSLIGILAQIADVLASACISIFAISTFNTDYILIKADKLQDAIGVLSKNGYHFV